jgi:hypothetical protein
MRFPELMNSDEEKAYSLRTYWLFSSSSLAHILSARKSWPMRRYPFFGGCGLCRGRYWDQTIKFENQHFRLLEKGQFSDIISFISSEMIRHSYEEGKSLKL